jgi:hypothetical protein
MKIKNLLIIALFLISLNTVTAYQWACYDQGEMIFGVLECTSDCCQACAHDAGYQANINNCNGQSACTCDGITGNALDGTCVESWTCNEWGSCDVDSQTRTCTDSNSCGTTTSKPVESQTCDPAVPTNSELLLRIEALEGDVSFLENLVNVIQDLLNTILARINALENGVEPPTGCAYDNPTCGVGYECTDNVCVELVGCTYNNPDCATGFTCTENVCVEDAVPTGCAYNNPDCATGFTCTENVCVEDAVPTGCAYNNPDCATGFTCTENVCVEDAPLGCAFDDPSCDAGYECVDNACLELVGCAYNNPDCDTGFTCTENVCVEDVPLGCAFDDPSCGAGYECVDNACVELVGCTYSNPDCDSGYECVDNTCVIPTEEVVFRTNAYGDYGSSNTEIVVDRDNDGTMECYEYYSYYRNYRPNNPPIVGYTPEGYQIHQYSSGRILVNYGNKYIYKLATSCSIPETEIPTEPYKSDGQEVYN